MSLSHEERQRLEELAGELAREDPRLGRALTDDCRGNRFPSAAEPATTDRRPLASSRPALRHRVLRRRPLQWLAVAVTMASLPLLILAVIVQQPLIFGLGAVALIGGPTVSLIASRR